MPTQRNGRWCFNPNTFVSTPHSFHTASFAICTSSLATKMYFIARKPSIQYEIAFAWAFLWLFIAEAVMIGVISKCAWFFLLSFCSQWVRVCVYFCNSLLPWNAICFCVHRNCLCTEHQHFDPWHNRSCEGRKNATNSIYIHLYHRKMCLLIYSDDAYFIVEFHTRQIIMNHAHVIIIQVNVLIKFFGTKDILRVLFTNLFNLMNGILWVCE